MFIKTLFQKYCFFPISEYDKVQYFWDTINLFNCDKTVVINSCDHNSTGLHANFDFTKEKENLKLIHIQGVH